MCILRMCLPLGHQYVCCYKYNKNLQICYSLIVQPDVWVLLLLNSIKYYVYAEYTL